jgi:hypothetical protein
MQQWTRALVRQGKFLQQMDPVDGTFTEDLGDYSPAALCFTEFTWRLSGVSQTVDGLEWNVRPPEIGRDGQVPGASNEIPKPMVIALRRAGRWMASR